MRAPGFWREHRGISTLLLPLASLYESASLWHRILSKPVKLPVPVICVGNLTAGGAGKTPVALAIGEALKARGVNAFFLSRGYGGEITQATRVEPMLHAARQVGDEPLLLAQVLPTIIAKNRLEGAKLAIKQGAKIIVMDDGFQNYAFEKTLSLVVIDGGYGFGNGRLLPAGPLREKPALALKRAHAVVVVGRTNIVLNLPEEKPVLYAKALPKTVYALKGKPSIAFCGIARPEKFFDALGQIGARTLETVVFDDHHPYTLADMNRLAALAREKQAQLITTPKDAVRLDPAFRKKVAVVDVALSWEAPQMLEILLNYALEQA